MTRQVRLTVNEHDVAGSSLLVLRRALMREVRSGVGRYRRARSPRGRLRAANDVRAASGLALEAGCRPVDVWAAGRGVGAEGEYSAVAGPNVPQPQRARRDQLLRFLRANPSGRTVLELMERMNRLDIQQHGPRDDREHYNYDLCTGDLRQLERYGLARSSGHPKVWTPR